MATELKVQGTVTGRVSSKELVISNTPKVAKAPRRARVSGDSVGLDLCGVETAQAEGAPVWPEICGWHLGPRTKFSHPYNYDPILVYSGPGVPTGAVYSDRFRGWFDYAELCAKMQKHFGEQSDLYTRRSVPAIQAFLRDLLQKPDLKITRIEEQCNQATGFPLWYFEYKASEEVVQAPELLESNASLGQEVAGLPRVGN